LENQAGKTKNRKKHAIDRSAEPGTRRGIGPIPEDAADCQLAGFQPHSERYVRLKIMNPSGN